MKLYEGKVKWFDIISGHGLIYCEEINDEVYVHYSDIDRNGFKYLEMGDFVVFGLLKGSKRWVAKQVVYLGA